MSRRLTFQCTHSPLRSTSILCWRGPVIALCPSRVGMRALYLYARLLFAYFSPVPLARVLATL